MFVRVLSPVQFVHLPFIVFSRHSFFLFVCISIIEESLFLVVNKIDYITIIIKNKKCEQSGVEGGGGGGVVSVNIFAVRETVKLS